MKRAKIFKGARCFNKTRTFLKNNPREVFTINQLIGKLPFSYYLLSKDLKLLVGIGDLKHMELRPSGRGRWPTFYTWKMEGTLHA